MERGDGNQTPPEQISQGIEDSNSPPRSNPPTLENISSRLAVVNIEDGSVPPAALQGQYHSSQGESTREGQLINSVITQNPLTTTRFSGYERLPQSCYTCADNADNISSHLAAAANSQVRSFPRAAIQGQYHSAEGESSMQGQLANDVRTQNLLNLVPPALVPLCVPRYQQCNKSNIAGFQSYYGRAAPPMPSHQLGLEYLPIVAAAVNQARHRADQTYTAILRALLGDTILLDAIQSGFLLQPPVEAYRILSHQQLHGQVCYDPPLQGNSAHRPPPLPPFSQPPPAPPGYSTDMVMPSLLGDHDQLGSMNFEQRPPPFPTFSLPPPAPPQYSTYMGMPSLLGDYDQRGSMNFVQGPPPLPPFSQPPPAPPGYSTYMYPPSLLWDSNQRGSMNFAEGPPLPPFSQPPPAPPGHSTYMGIPPLLWDYDADDGETDGHSSTNVRRAGHPQR